MVMLSPTRISSQQALMERSSLQELTRQVSLCLPECPQAEKHYLREDFIQWDPTANQLQQELLRMDNLSDHPLTIPQDQMVALYLQDSILTESLYPQASLQTENLFHPMHTTQ